jgi:hypothetical protein
MCCPFFFHLFSQQQSNNSTKHTHNTPSLCHLGSAYYYSMYIVVFVYFIITTQFYCCVYFRLFFFKRENKSRNFFFLFFTFETTRLGFIAVLSAFCFVLCVSGLTWSDLQFSTPQATQVRTTFRPDIVITFR